MADLRKEDDLAGALQVSRTKLRNSWMDLYKKLGKEVRLDIGGKSLKWPIVSFSKALQHLVQFAPVFQRLIRDTWLAHPCSQTEPWSIIVYRDEIVPGNVLRPENHRKLMC